MPLGEVDPNADHHFSRSPERLARDLGRLPKPATSDTLASGIGVTSMLKTTTETGDLGLLSFHSSGRLPKLPSASSRKNLSHAPLRAPSSQYSRTASLRSKASNTSVRSARLGHDPVPASWLGGQRHRYHHADDPRPSDTSSLTAQQSVRSLAHDIRERLERSERSMSLTHSVASVSDRQLSNHRSLSSLKSVGPLLRPSSPLVRQGKLCKPRDHRTASPPALTDQMSALWSRRPAHPYPGPRAYTADDAPLGRYETQGQPRFASHHGPAFPRPPRSQLHQPGQRRPYPSPDRFTSPSSRATRVPAIESYNLNALERADASLNTSLGPIKQSPGSPEHHLCYSHAMTSQSQQLPRLESTSRVASQRAGINANVVATPPTSLVERVRCAMEESISPEESKTVKRVSHLRPVTSELPASPVVRRLNRDTIRGAVAASSHDSETRDTLGDTRTVGLPPDTTIKRLTRELVKAAIKGSFSDETTSEDMQSSPPICQKFVESNSSLLLGAVDDESRPRDADVVTNDIFGSNKTIPQIEYASSSKTSTEADRSISSSTPANAPGSFTTTPSTHKTGEDRTPKSVVPSRLNETFGWRNKQPMTRPDADVNFDPGRECAPDPIWLSDSPGPSFGGLSTTCLDSPVRSQHAHDRQTKGNTARDAAGKLPDGPNIKIPFDQEDFTAFTGSPGETQISSLSAISPHSWRGDGTRGNDDKVRIVLAPSDFASNSRFASKDTRPRSAGDVLEHQFEAKDYKRQQHLQRFSVQTPDRKMPAAQSYAMSHANGKCNLWSAEKTDSWSSARHSISNHLNMSRFGLADLTEDSQEDYSATNLRMLGAKPPIFSGGRQDREKRALSKASPRVTIAEKTPTSYLVSGPHGTLELPTLNFSKNDLTVKLNRALGIRCSRSLESLAGLRVRSSAASLTVTERHRSASMGKERYRSFFDIVQDRDVQSLSAAAKTDTLDDDDDDDGEKAARILSKAEADLLEEIHKLSIPSVQHLSQRISELFPSMLRASYSETDLDAYNDAIDATVDQIQQLASPGRLAAMNLRAERSVVDQDTPLLFRRSTISGEQPLQGNQRKNRGAMLIDLMKALPALPKAASKASILGDVDKMPHLDGVTELATSGRPNDDWRRSDARQCDRARPKEERSYAMPTDAEMKKSASTVHAGSTPLSAESTVPPDQKMEPKSPATVDFTLPVVPSGVDMLEGRAGGLAGLDSEDLERIVRSMSPSFEACLVPATDGADSEDDETTSKNSKTGVLGGLARRMGMRPRVDRAGFALDPRFLHPEERAMDPGDRYPTTALTAPSSLTLDGRSYFSDDSSIREERRSFRRRMTGLKFRRSASRPLPLTRFGKDGTPAQSSPEVTPQDTLTRDGSTFSDIDVHESSDSDGAHMILTYEQPSAAGMSKTEFRAKRFLQKLRALWAKGGRLLRGGKRKRDHPPILE